MKPDKKFLSIGLAVCGVGLLAFPASAGSTLEELFDGGVPAANPRQVGVSYPNLIAPGLVLSPVAAGADLLENPSGIITRFGYLNDGDIQPVEPSKTEPDENTYLFLSRNPKGPTPGYNYGHRFLFQGHENANDLAYITRINLDVTDPAHRITLMTPVGGDGKTHLNRLDGSTWDPFTQTLLFTQENGAVGGVVELTATSWPPTLRNLYGILGQGGYEGIHPDDWGNLIIIEDVGGTSVNIDPSNTNSAKAARNPNSFVYRFVPNNRSDLGAGGKLQALQVSIGAVAVTFVKVDTNNPTGDVFSDNQLKLHTLGTSWPCRWVTIHDTATSTAPFDANAAAKSAGATPFKRPENAQFVPGSGFRTFFFCPTGDTDARSGNTPALAARGAWGSLFRVDLDASRDTGVISVFYVGDAAHAAFDNLAFLNNRVLLATEDRGDNLHRQLNALDSIWAFDIGDASTAPVRFLALGRDPSSTTDSQLLEAPTPGFQNDGDNEPTGLHFSDGLSQIQTLLGTKPNIEGGRWFFTQQHGDNTVFEIVAPPPAEED